MCGHYAGDVRRLGTPPTTQTQGERTENDHTARHTHRALDYRGDRSCSRYRRRRAGPARRSASRRADRRESPRRGRTPRQVRHHPGQRARLRAVLLGQGDEREGQVYRPVREGLASGASTGRCKGSPARCRRDGHLRRGDAPRRDAPARLQPPPALHVPGRQDARANPVRRRGRLARLPAQPLTTGAAHERQGDLTSASARRRVAAEVAQASQRATSARLLEGWAAHHLGVPPIAVAYALRTAVRAVAVQRAEGGVELVWTGPNPEGTPLRRTDQALLEVIDAAQHTLTVVTFAAYSVPAIAAALVRAAQRGVRIRIIIESAQVSEGKIAYEAMDALGAHVSAMAAVYMWPLAHRPLDDKGRHGSLHAKCAVADDAVLFISS